jgi:hypothetical protein
MLYRINAKGRANLTEYLAAILKDPDSAYMHAGVVVEETHWFDDQTKYVEIRGYYTKTGNPETYTFDHDEVYGTEENED